MVSADGLTFSGSDRYWVDLALFRFDDVRVYLFTNGTRYPVANAHADLAFDGRGVDPRLTPINGHLAMTDVQHSPWRMVWATLDSYVRSLLSMHETRILLCNNMQNFSHDSSFHIGNISNEPETCEYTPT